MRPLLAIFCLLLTACGSEDRLVSSPEVATTESVRIRFASVEVMEISLPEYADEAELYIEKDGTLVGSGLLWADDPSRAVTLALSRHLAQITGAFVAPEPWPFESFPDGRVDVRVERLLADENGLLTLAGQVFVADTVGRGRDRARLFTLTSQLDDASDAAALARARADLVAQLALLIAKDGLR